MWVSEINVVNILNTYIPASPLIMNNVSFVSVHVYVVRETGEVLYIYDAGGVRGGYDDTYVNCKCI